MTKFGKAPIYGPERWQARHGTAWSHWEGSYVIHEGPGGVKSPVEVFDFRNCRYVAVRHGSIGW